MVIPNDNADGNEIAEHLMKLITRCPNIDELNKIKGQLTTLLHTAESQAKIIDGYANEKIFLLSYKERSGFAVIQANKADIEIAGYIEKYDVIEEVECKRRGTMKHEKTEAQLKKKYNLPDNSKVWERTESDLIIPND